MIAATYRLTIHTPEKPAAYSRPGLMLHFDRLLRETEENLTDLLPEGWWVEIHEQGQIVWRDSEDDSGYYVPGQREGDNDA